jgi:hypothetical protein
MSRATVEDYLKISTQALKRLGYLNTGYTFKSTVYWGNSDNRPNISVSSDLTSNNLFVVFKYNHKNRYNNETTEVETKIFLDKTNCYFGGVRYWFKCPSCFKRVGCLYGVKYFLCRSCYDLSYDSCNKSKNRFTYVSKAFDLEDKRESLYKNKRWQTQYNNKPTKRYLKYLWLRGMANYKAGLWLEQRNNTQSVY